MSESYQSTPRAKAAKALLQGLDGFEERKVKLHRLRQLAAEYKRNLGGGARRAHEDCIRSMNANRAGWLGTMRSNLLFLESNHRRDLDARGGSER